MSPSDGQRGEGGKQSKGGIGRGKNGDKELNRITFRPGESYQFAHFLPPLMWLAGHTLTLAQRFILCREKNWR